MTTFELIQKLSQFPADTKVVIAHDWSEPLVDPEYLAIEGDPTVTLNSSGHSQHPVELERLQAVCV